MRGWFITPARAPPYGGTKFTCFATIHINLEIPTLHSIIAAWPGSFAIQIFSFPSYPQRRKFFCIAYLGRRSERQLEPSSCRNDIEVYARQVAALYVFPGTLAFFLLLFPPRRGGPCSCTRPWPWVIEYYICRYLHKLLKMLTSDEYSTLINYMELVKDEGRLVHVLYQTNDQPATVSLLA